MTSSFVNHVAKFFTLGERWMELLLGCDSLSEIIPRVETLFTDDSDPTHGLEGALYCAKDLLNLFCQLNWTGPPVDETSETYQLLTGSSHLNGESFQQLSSDGEPPYSLCRQPVLLCLAHELLLRCRKGLGLREFDGLLVARCHWWGLRCLFVQQRLLWQRSATLWEKISQMVQDLQPYLETKLLSDDELCELHLELGHMMLYYSQYDAAQKYFQQACAIAKITIELTGALGKRTKFQQKDTAQLLLKVESSLDSGDRNFGARLDRSELPKDLMLGDDTLLEQVQYTDPQTVEQLTPLQQTAILGMCTQLQKTNPVHKLTAEERAVYVNCVLSTPQCWVVHCHALLLRCQLEKERRRTVERAMMQLQELVDSYSKLSPKACDRMQLFYSTPLQPWWVVKKELADVMVSLGLPKEALEVYQRLELWEEVIGCYHSTGRGGRAEEIIRQQLALKETPTMWCLLGDVTKDPQFYLKAWELSNHSSARSQKSLGLFYLRKQCYKECIESLQLSLSINSLQEGLWFSLGCAANSVGDNDLAVKSFHRCVSIEPDFAEAWNNLAAAYLKKRDKVRAFHVYKEALKRSYDNWKIWENFLLVSTDIGEFEESIKAYHRLLDLKEKFTDVEVLKLIVGAVVNDTPDRNELPASKHRKKIGELLGRIVAQTTMSADTWKLYADYHFSSEDTADHEKGLMELQKAQRSSKLVSGWEKEISKLKRVVGFTMDYCQACRRMGTSQDKNKSSASLSSAKLALQSIISKTKGFGISSSPETEELVARMEEEKKLLLEAIENLQQQN